MEPYNYPELHNKRAAKVWYHLSRSGLEFAGKSILDIGCGGGDLAFRAHSCGASQVLGIDKDSAMVSLAQRRAGRYFRINNLPLEAKRRLAFERKRFVPGGATIGQGTFDIILCINVLPSFCHSPEDLAYALSCLKVMAPIVILEVPTEPGDIGQDWLTGDMLAGMLANNFMLASPIVKTQVKFAARTVERDVWVCE